MKIFAQKISSINDFLDAEGLFPLSAGEVFSNKVDNFLID